MIAAIVGAGPLATALASTLAARGPVRHIRLIDDAGTVASGKALDIRQATPVLGSDVSIEASADLAAAADADVIVIADSDNWSTEIPSLTVSLRGLADCVVEVATLDHGVTPPSMNRPSSSLLIEKASGSKKCGAAVLARTRVARLYLSLPSWVAPSSQ